jgi:hypothetical protein
MDRGRRPFRFGVTGEALTSRERPLDTAQRAEALGYSTLLLRDHFVAEPFGDQLAPLVVLAERSPQRVARKVEWVQQAAEWVQQAAERLTVQMGWGAAAGEARPGDALGGRRPTRSGRRRAAGTAGPVRVVLPGRG